MANYPDNPFSKISAGGYDLVKIEIEPVKCAGSYRYFQFALTKSDLKYAEVVVYDHEGNASAWHMFKKLL